jgi:hypothetical protein
MKCMAGEDYITRIKGDQIKEDEMDVAREKWEMCKKFWSKDPNVFYRNSMGKCGLDSSESS